MRMRRVIHQTTLTYVSGAFGACIRAGGRRHDLGRFETELEAAAAYDTAALHLIGTHAGHAHTRMRRMRRMPHIRRKPYAA